VVEAKDTAIGALTATIAAQRSEFTAELAVRGSCRARQALSQDHLLAICWRDRVPVGGMITTQRPVAAHRIRACGRGMNVGESAWCETAFDVPIMIHHDSSGVAAPAVAAPADGVADRSRPGVAGPGWGLLTVT